MRPDQFSAAGVDNIGGVKIQRLPLPLSVNKTRRIDHRSMPALKAWKTLPHAEAPSARQRELGWSRRR
jgi:hypothetical protein